MSQMLVASSPHSPRQSPGVGLHLKSRNVLVTQGRNGASIHITREWWSRVRSVQGTARTATCELNSYASSMRHQEYDLCCSMIASSMSGNPPSFVCRLPPSFELLGLLRELTASVSAALVSLSTSGVPPGMVTARLLVVVNATFSEIKHDPETSGFSP
jgi:hypothetical protein